MEAFCFKSSYNSWCTSEIKNPTTQTKTPCSHPQSIAPSLSTTALSSSTHRFCFSRNPIDLASKVELDASKSITESQTCGGWKEPLGITSSNPSAEAGSPGAHCPGSQHPGGFGIPPRRLHSLLQASSTLTAKKLFLVFVWILLGSSCAHCPLFCC